MGFCPATKCLDILVWSTGIITMLEWLSECTTAWVSKVVRVYLRLYFLAGEVFYALRLSSLLYHMTLKAFLNETQTHIHAVVYSLLFPSLFLLATSKDMIPWFPLRELSSLISCGVAGMVNFQVPVCLHGIWKSLLPSAPRGWQVT